MKTRLIRKGWIWALSAVLLPGVAYSMLALQTQPVYASSCDCVEAHQDGNELCFGFGYGRANEVACDLQNSTFTAVCQDGFIFPGVSCSF